MNDLLARIRLVSRVATTCGLLFISTVGLKAANWYVTPSGAGTHSGVNWSEAWHGTGGINWSLVKAVTRSGWQAAVMAHSFGGNLVCGPSIDFLRATATEPNAQVPLAGRSRLILRLFNSGLLRLVLPAFALERG